MILKSKPPLMGSTKTKRDQNYSHHNKKEEPQLHFKNENNILAQKSQIQQLISPGIENLELGVSYMSRD